AQAVFEPVWRETQGDNGWVSFELDPLLEDVASTMPVAERTKKYIELGKKWSTGHKNRMIKVPATPGGLAAIEDLVTAGVCVNITLIFSERQYKLARDAAWRGLQRAADSDIETNPPATNKAVEESGRTMTRHVDELPPADVLAEIDKKVDVKKLEETLMREGLAKFADPQKALIKLISEKRAALK